MMIASKRKSFPSESVQELMGPWTQATWRRVCFALRRSSAGFGQRNQVVRSFPEARSLIGTCAYFFASKSTAGPCRVFRRSQRWSATFLDSGRKRAALRCAAVEGPCPGDKIGDHVILKIFRIRGKHSQNRMALLLPPLARPTTFSDVHFLQLRSIEF